jgi:Rad3-related DNA helicase
LPYNYLLGRRNSKVDLSNGILLFDEAHNIEELLEDSKSFTLSSSLLQNVYEEINLCKGEISLKELKDANISLRAVLSGILLFFFCCFIYLY